MMAVAHSYFPFVGAPGALESKNMMLNGILDLLKIELIQTLAARAFDLHIAAAFGQKFETVFTSQLMKHFLQNLCHVSGKIPPACTSKAALG